MRELYFTYQIQPHPAQVSRAREQIRKLLPGWGLAELDDTAELIISELVTNALLHTTSPITITLTCNQTHLTIEVSDHDDAMPIPRHPGHIDENGRGLQLITALITAHHGQWGTTRHPRTPGKTIHARLPRPTPW